MTVKKLMEILAEQPEDANVYVACQGYDNYDPKHHTTYSGGDDTYVLKAQGQLFICDGCRIEWERDIE